MSTPLFPVEDYKKPIYMGIDPGQKGGIAVINSNLSIAEAWTYPGDESLAASLYRTIIGKYIILDAYIEQVHAMPNQGVVSMFSFGANYGIHKGILSALLIPYTIVAPQVWKKQIFGRLGKQNKGFAKVFSLEKARERFPDVDLSRRCDDGKADALFIALCCEENNNSAERVL